MKSYFYLDELFQNLMAENRRLITEFCQESESKQSKLNAQPFEMTELDTANPVLKSVTLFYIYFHGCV